MMDHFKYQRADRLREEETRIKLTTHDIHYKIFTTGITKYKTKYYVGGKRVTVIFDKVEISNLACDIIINGKIVNFFNKPLQERTSAFPLLVHNVMDISRLNYNGTLLVHCILKLYEKNNESKYEVDSFHAFCDMFDLLEFKELKSMPTSEILLVVSCDLSKAEDAKLADKIINNKYPYHLLDAQQAMDAFKKSKPKRRVEKPTTIIDDDTRLEDAMHDLRIEISDDDDDVSMISYGSVVLSSDGESDDGEHYAEEHDFSGSDNEEHDGAGSDNDLDHNEE
jgi:hypothetical protein